MILRSSLRDSFFRASSLTFLLFWKVLFANIINSGMTNSELMRNFSRRSSSLKFLNNAITFFNRNLLHNEFLKNRYKNNDNDKKVALFHFTIIYETCKICLNTLLLSII